MNREEFVQRLVLDKICDDYENVDQIILRDVAKDATECGLTIERSDAVDALAKLITHGLAKAYILSSREPFSSELDGMPSLDVVEENFRTYLYATKKGIDLQISDETWWPFNRVNFQPKSGTRGSYGPL